MNNIHRVGLATASLVATLVVAGVFIVDGYTSAQGSALPQTPTLGSPTQNTPPAAPQTIYVMPAPTPGHVTITQTAPNSTPPVTHIIVAAPGGGDDSGGGDR
jgi:hypothetical protein